MYDAYAATSRLAAVLEGYRRAGSKTELSKRYNTSSLSKKWGKLTYRPQKRETHTGQLDRYRLDALASRNH